MSGAARGPKATREVMGTRDWVVSAECRDAYDPDAFFPIAEQEGPTLYAKGLCARCPVSAACLRWALDNGMDRGIWGGLTEQERRELKVRRLVGKAGQ